MTIILDEQGAAEREFARMSGRVVASEASPAISAMLRAEDKYWVNVFGDADADTGMELDDLKAWGEQLEEAVVGNPHMGRGFRLRASYVLKDGIHHRNIPGKSPGRARNVQTLVDDPENQDNYFSPEARVRKERSLYTKGLAVYLGDDKTGKLTALPLSRVTADYKNPTGLNDEVWAYLIEWDETHPATRKKTHKKRWVFTDRFPGFPDHMRPKRKGKAWVPDAIEHGGEGVPVEKGWTILDQHSNTVDGLAYGAPDALAALVWARIARDLYMDGVTMTHALATFAFKATKGTQAGANKAQMALATPQAPGSTAVVGGVQELVPMSSAGKGYDFDSFRAVIAIVAAALDVSVIHLTADPGTAGASYGSAQTLDLPTRLSMESRRQEDVAFEKRVLRWMGAKDAEAYFIPFTDSTEMLRDMQVAVLKWNLGLYEALEMKSEIEGTRLEDTKVPTGVLLPNNEKSLARKDIDTDSAADGPNAGTTSAPGQGQSTGAGRTGDSHDTRTDGIANSEKMLELLDRMIALDEKQWTSE